MNPLAEGKWTIVNTTISAETGKEDEAKKVKDALPTSFELREDGSCSLNEIALPGQTWGFTGSILSIYSLMGNERMTIHEWNATIFVDKMTITYRASDKLTLVQREIAKAQELMDSNEITSTDKIPIATRLAALKVEEGALKAFANDGITVKAEYKRNK